MKRLHDKVNVVPVIAKSDTMTPEEIVHFKRQIMNQIVQAKIRDALTLRHETKCLPQFYSTIKLKFIYTDMPNLIEMLKNMLLLKNPQFLRNHYEIWTK